MKISFEGTSPVIFLDGRISNLNAIAVENNLNELIKNIPTDEKILVLDVYELEFISSAGIRIFLKLAKKFHKLIIREATPEVFSVLDMTGLTKIISVTRALREVSPEGAQIIGRGYAGTVYRLSDDLILKLYNSGITRDLVNKEKERAERAFLSGIPTAVSYDVVRHGDQFGIVFELMNAKNLAEVFAADPDHFDDIVRREANFLRMLNETPLEPDQLPDMKDNYKWHLNRTGKFLSSEEIAALVRLVDSIPNRYTFLHGDFHPKNVMVSNDEFVLIDMTDVALGHPIFDLMCVCFSCKHSTWGRPELLPQIIGFDTTTAEKYLTALFDCYFEAAGVSAVAEGKALAEKLSWLRRLVALPYLPLPVTERELDAARREFFPTIGNLLDDHRELLDTL